MGVEHRLEGFLFNNRILGIIYDKYDKLVNRFRNMVRVKRLTGSNMGYDFDNTEILEEAVILIHTGKKQIPEYVKDCIKQIRLMDENIDIFFVCPKSMDVSSLTCCNVIHEEELILCSEHKEFLNKISHMNIISFFQVTIERFFVLCDVMHTLRIKRCLHLENDNLLYANATKLIQKLSIHYDGIAVPRAGRTMSCASVMFIPDINALSDFLNFINHESEDIFFNDMALLSAYVDTGRGRTLPIIYKDYVRKIGLKTYENKNITEKEKETDYYNFADELEGIFDCAALGQYLDGCDPIFHPDKRVGFINPNTYIDPRNLMINWTVYNENMMIPYLSDGKREYRLYNLHVHSKRLNKFCSDAVYEISQIGKKGEA